MMIPARNKNSQTLVAPSGPTGGPLLADFLSFLKKLMIKQCQSQIKQKENYYILLKN